MKIDDVLTYRELVKHWTQESTKTDAAIARFKVAVNRVYYEHALSNVEGLIMAHECTYPTHGHCHCEELVKEKNKLLELLGEVKIQ